MVPKTWPSSFPGPKFKRETNNPIVFYTCFSFFCIIFSFWSTLFCILFVNTFHIAHLNFAFISIDLSLLTLSILLYSIRRSQWTVSWKVSVIWSRIFAKFLHDSYWPYEDEFKKAWNQVNFRNMTRNHEITTCCHATSSLESRETTFSKHSLRCDNICWHIHKATLKQNVNLRFPQKDVRAIDFITICIQNIEVIDEIGHSSW